MINFKFMQFKTLQANIALYSIHAIDARDIYQYVLVTLLVGKILYLISIKFSML